MKILVICQYYSPEPFRITDICEELVKRGHEVTVVTGLPNYPMGEIYEGYRNGQHRKEIINDVEIYRCFTIGRKKGVVYRFLNYYSYMISSTNLVKKIDKDFDVVFVNQLSPVMMANAGVKYKKITNKKLVMYCLDLWPESLTLGGVKKGSSIYKYFHKVSKKLYNSADKIAITSRTFEDYFRDMFDIREVVYLPQYAEDLFNMSECRKTPDQFIDVMFAGNVGVAQSVDTILEAAKLTADITSLRWHIVGDGSELEKLETKMKGCENMIFHGRKPLEEMPRYYAMADAMLVTMQKDPIISLTLPGKLQTYMAAGKVIIGAVDGEARKIIDEAKCGFCSEAENAEALANNIRIFIQSNHKEEMCLNSRKFYEDHFEKGYFMNQLEQLLKGNCY